MSTPNIVKFMTTAPNALTDSINNERMPVLLNEEADSRLGSSDQLLRPLRWREASTLPPCGSCSRGSKRRICWLRDD